MAEAETKVPVKTEKTGPATGAPWHPIENLRREVDRLFEDFGAGFWSKPSRRSLFDLGPLWNQGLSVLAAPAVDLVEKDTGYEVSAELPGLSEKQVEVTVANGNLSIKGEKQEEKEEKKKDYYVHERQFGSFSRSFRIPEGVDTDKIEASFKNGVLKINLPKKPEAQKPAKKIDVKSA